MDPNIIQSFGTGMATSLSIGPFAEAWVHRKFLHAKPNERNYAPHGTGLTRVISNAKAIVARYIDNATYGHQDCHHHAYKQKEHYYRDVTNEAEVIHFAKGDVGLIAAIASGVGTTIAALTASVQSIGPESFHMGPNHFAYTAGFVAGTMTYYGGYEIFHHNMHVIGKRRLEINRVLGDYIQGGTENRDSHLRLSKPLLDDVCNAVEGQVDKQIGKNRKPWVFEKMLENRLKLQIMENQLEGAANLASPLPSEYELLSATADTMIDRERINPTGYFTRMWQHHLRNSPLFERIDNHHFVHHVKFLSNLNVLVPLADYCLGTKVDSSRRELEENKLYWLCPNSPDEKPFVRPIRKNRRTPTPQTENELLAA